MCRGFQCAGEIHPSIFPQTAAGARDRAGPGDVEVNGGPHPPRLRPKKYSGFGLGLELVSAPLSYSSMAESELNRYRMGDDPTRRDAPPQQSHMLMHNGFNDAQGSSASKSRAASLASRPGTSTSRLTASPFSARGRQCREERADSEYSSLTGTPHRVMHRLRCSSLRLAVLGRVDNLASIRGGRPRRRRRHRDPPQPHSGSQLREPPC